jgi:hypothetical protein
MHRRMGTKNQAWGQIILDGYQNTYCVRIHAVHIENQAL